MKHSLWGLHHVRPLAGRPLQGPADALPKSGRVELHCHLSLSQFPTKSTSLPQLIAAIDNIVHGFVTESSLLIFAIVMPALSRNAPKLLHIVDRKQHATMD